MRKKGLLIYLMCFLTACSITPKPVSVCERYEQAKRDIQLLFDQQEPLCTKLDFYQALARGLKYNLDYRIKLVNSALQAGQLRIAMYTMFPALNVSGSLYNRNNVYASSGITSTGQPTDVLNSTPNTIRSARIGLSWNILDLGMGYVRARQQGERLLIAEEESRKQLQQLSQDVLIAYWSAYSAQELMVETREFQALLASAKHKLEVAMHDRAIPKESILNFQAALLEGNRRLVQLQYKYDKAMLDLKHLVNLPLQDKLVLAPPPIELSRPQNLSDLDFRKVDSITLVYRSELRGQFYQQRIAKWGIKTAILQALPGITLNAGWNYNSNKYLVNNVWVDKSVDVAWNLLNVVSLPASYETAKTQVEYEKLKLMALTMTVLTQTRYAYSHYETLRNEYLIAHKQTENARALYRLNRDRRLASLASDQQVIVAKLRTLTTKMDENVLMADMSTALGELYLSVGSDLLPLEIGNKPLCEIVEMISQNFKLQNTWNFKEYINRTYDKLFSNIIFNNIPCAPVATKSCSKPIEHFQVGMPPKVAQQQRMPIFQARPLMAQLQRVPIFQTRPQMVQQQRTPIFQARPLMAQLQRVPIFQARPQMVQQQRAPIFQARPLMAQLQRVPIFQARPLMAQQQRAPIFQPRPQMVQPQRAPLIVQQVHLPILQRVFMGRKSKIEVPNVSQNNHQAELTIQIYGSFDLNSVKAVQKELELTQVSNIAWTQNKGKYWYVLVYGKYSSGQVAHDAFKQLSGDIRDLSPWIRKTTDLHWMS